MGSLGIGIPEIIEFSFTTKQFSNRKAPSYTTKYMCSVPNLLGKIFNNLILYYYIYAPVFYLLSEGGNTVSPRVIVQG